ncbi:MAG: monovalent cation/H(+) antiporter subunit G [Spiribacter sp.]|jgi:multicomponent Na+:H+ antiporter subunit G|nr:monovalent cation/H(+) antiporter subunit G [Spiribacter sp.]MDR9489046.1 monovalent cation/H(+) antiporter subunit G [Spiribacter sp.]
MIELLGNLLTSVLLLTGGAFAIIGGVGFVRFPDVYTRLHAGSIADTAAPLLIISGLLVQTGFSLLSIKLLLILFFLLFTSPAAAHATARAALEAGLEPIGADERRQGGASSNS